MCKAEEKLECAMQMIASVSVCMADVGNHVEFDGNGELRHKHQGRVKEDNAAVARLSKTKIDYC